MKEDAVRNYLEALIHNHLITMQHAGAAPVPARGEDKGRTWEEVG